MTATFPPVPALQTNEVPQINRIVDAVNRLNQGKANVTLVATLTANAATTTLTDARISAQSFIDGSPHTANAAAAKAGMYYSEKKKGSVVVNHANNSQTDKTFTFVIIG